MSDGALALAGVKVLDLGTMVTAPFAAMMLGQLGADVTKIEHPDGGDPFRRTTGGSYSPNFVAYNQNKKSIQLDLGADEGRTEFLRLLASTDVLVENFRPGVIERFGLGPEVLSKANPRLIHCSITGFGPDGPYRDRPAYDTVGIALSGILHLYLEPDRPRVLGPTLSDNVAGLYACNGILAALHRRAATNAAQRVEVNMLESAIAFNPDAFAYLTQLNRPSGPLSRVASSQCFVWNCADGRPISIHLSVQDRFWQALTEAVDPNGTLAADARFSDRKRRVANYAELADAIGMLVARYPRSHWEEVFTAGDIPFAPVLSIPDVMEDPQVRHLGTFMRADHPTEGVVTGIRTPIRINGVRGAVTAPPTLGEHHDQPDEVRRTGTTLVSSS